MINKAEVDMIAGVLSRHHIPRGYWGDGARREIAMLILEMLECEREKRASAVQQDRTPSVVA